jgi:hypothetical protein
MIFNGGSNKSLFDPENVEGTPEWFARHSKRRNNMQIEVEIWNKLYHDDSLYPQAQRNEELKGSIEITLPNTESSNYNKSHKNYKYLGTTMIDIKEPKRKKLVYQWLYESPNNDTLNLTVYYYGMDEKDKVRRHCNTKEGGILKPVMESEKEIDV